MSDAAKARQAQESAGDQHEGGTGGRMFVAWTDVMEIARKEDASDFAFRELRFHLFFFVLVVPFVMLQARTQVRFQTYRALHELLEETPFIVEFDELEDQMPTSFWIPPDELAEDSPERTTFRPLRFAQINSANEMWDWLTQVVGQALIFPQLCANNQSVSEEERFWYNNNATVEETVLKSYEPYCAAAAMPGNYLLDGVRLRTVVVEPESLVHPDDRTFINYYFPDVVRFPEFSLEDEASSLERSGKFVAESNTIYPDISTFVFSWEQAAVLGDIDTQGSVSTYPGSGFTVVLPIDGRTSWYSIKSKIATYRNGVFALKNDVMDFENTTGRFLSNGVRLLVVSMTLYNPNNNLYSFVECAFELSAAGAITSFVNYYIAPSPAPPSNAFERTELAFASLSFVYFILCYARFLRNANWYRNGSLWVLGEITALVLYAFMLQWIVRYYFTKKTRIDFPDAAIYASQVTDPFWICLGEETTYTWCGGQPPFSTVVGEYAKEYCTMQVIYATVILLGFGKLFRYMLVMSPFHVMAKAGRLVRRNLLYYSLIFVIIFVGFSIAGYLFFSPYIPAYASFGTSMLRQLLIYVRVDVIYAELTAVNQVSNSFAPIFFFSFFFIFVWTFASVLLAVIYNAWQSVMGEHFKGTKEAALRKRRLTLLATLHAQGNFVEKVSSARKTPVRDRVTLQKMKRDREYRAKGCGICLERSCRVSRKGWISKENVLINLREWEGLPENADKVFLDSKTLRKALRGLGDKVPHQDQSQRFFDLLRHKAYTKTEVDQLMAQLELQQRASAVSAVDEDSKGDRREGAVRPESGLLSSRRKRLRNGLQSRSSKSPSELQGPLLSVRTSIASALQSVTKDQDSFLFKIDQYLATLRVHQSQSRTDVDILSSEMEDLETMALASS